MVKIFTENQMVIKGEIKILPFFFGGLHYLQLPSPSEKQQLAKKQLAVSRKDLWDGISF